MGERAPPPLFSPAPASGVLLHPRPRTSNAPPSHPRPPGTKKTWMELRLPREVVLRLLLAPAGSLNPMGFQTRNHQTARHERSVHKLRMVLDPNRFRGLELLSAETLAILTTIPGQPFEKGGGELSLSRRPHCLPCFVPCCTGGCYTSTSSSSTG